MKNRLPGQAEAREERVFPSGGSQLSRRRFLECSLLAGGAGLTLADVLRLQAASASSGRSKTDTAVIQIWLGGGPSQFETFDPKPEAPREIRGPYGVIPTKYPGVLFCEMMPKTARVLDRAAIIRTVTHTTNGHLVGARWLSTGYFDTIGGMPRPSVGSIVASTHGPNHPGLPAYVLISEEQKRNLDIGSVTGPGYLGTRHAAFTIKQDPYTYEYRKDKTHLATANLQLANDITLERITSRRALWADLDRFARVADASQQLQGADQFHRAALRMVVSGEARDAFDLTLESEATRKLYGSHRWGQMALLARRLVEAGTTFVTLSTAPDSLCWDWHLNIIDDKRPANGSNGPSRGMNISGPPLDQMVSALVTDIYQRGLDKKVLLLVWGEFGRTPRINKTGGRDHWGALMSILMAGGGLRVDQVIGASNRNGEVPIERPIKPTDVLATVYRHLGIDWSQHTVDTQGRPHRIIPDGEPIKELI